MSGLLGGGKTSQSNTSPMEASLRISTSAYGLVLPIVYGTTRVPGNLLWYGAFTAIPHTTSSRTGKGGGGSTTTSTTYTYTASMMFGLSEGPIQSVGAIWKDKQYFSTNSLFSIYNGSYAQGAWPYLTSRFPAQALNYRGVAYAAAADYDLGQSSSTPNHSFEVRGILRDAGFANGYDAAPSEILQDFLTNENYGAGFPGAKLGDWTQYYNYTVATGLIFSPAIDSAKPAHEFITGMMKLTNSGVYFSEGLLKITPYGDKQVTGHGATYTPNLTPIYELTDDDFISNGMDDPVHVTRGSTADAYNKIQLEFINRANQYNVEISEAKDQANIETYGLRSLESFKAHEIADAEVARACSQLILQRSVYIRNTYQFRVGVKYSLLEPTDYVTITDTTLGLVDKPVRILTIEEEDDFTFAITAEDAPRGVSSNATYASQGSGGHINDYNVAPGDTNAPVIFAAPPVLADTGMEIWMAASGGEHWGGCEVWASYDGNSYARIGVVSSPARMGVLTASLPSGSDPDTTHTLSVNIISGLALQSVTQNDADAFVTLSYVDGELISYETATLTSANHYDLTYLRRGLYGTTIASHAVDSQFTRLDGAILKLPFTSDKIGKTLYLKFPAYNIYGNALQDISTLSAYTYVIPSVTVIDSGATAIATKTTNYTATRSDSTILCNASAAALAVTLPTAVDDLGRTYVVKKIDSSANAVTIATTASQTIDGLASRTLPNRWDSLMVQSDGSNWQVIGGRVAGSLFLA